MEPTKDEKKMRQEAKEQRKKILGHLAWIIPVVLLLALVIWLLTLPKIPESEIVSRQAIHWHPHLAIVIKGETIEIPANIGTGPAGAHSELIHTHDATGALHIEKSPPVYERDTELAGFFEVWDKVFTPTQIFDHVTGAEGTVKMFVNGEQNFEFGAYRMKDGDRIEIRYE